MNHKFKYKFKYKNIKVTIKGMNMNAYELRRLIMLSSHHVNDIYNSDHILIKKYETSDVEVRHYKNNNFIYESMTTIRDIIDYPYWIKEDDRNFFKQLERQIKLLELFEDDNFA